MLKTIIIASMLIFSSVTVGAQDEAPLLEQENTDQAEAPVHLKSATPHTVDPSKLYISPQNAHLDKKGEKAVQLAEDWISRPVLPTVEDKDGAVVYTFGVTLPVVVCKPLRVCVLQLEEGEEIIDPPRCGDTAQWEISPSKPDDRRQPHIYIKALDSGLTTNLIVVTDRRTYVVALKSRNDKYTPMVSFRYPGNEARAWREHLAEQARLEQQKQQDNQFKSGGQSFNAEDLDFEYTIKGDAKWKPLRVFNDGVKTYLKMPEVMKMYEAPVLMAVNDGKEALVNYRLHGDMFIVDQLFDKAVLLSGVGSNQAKITVTHAGK